MDTHIHHKHDLLARAAVSEIITVGAIIMYHLRNCIYTYCTAVLLYRKTKQTISYAGHSR